MFITARIRSRAVRRSLRLIRRHRSDDIQDGRRKGVLPRHRRKLKAELVKAGIDLHTR